ncbi:DUF120 domain-containing protein [Halorutilales archaeon Cl-col2-1]
MPELERRPPVKHEAVAVLKILGLEGGVEREVKTSCSGLGERIGTSDQTVSRRLQSLESSDLIDREMAADGQWIEITDEGERVLRNEYEEYRRIFEDATTVDLTGEVVSGMGEGEYYISLDGYQRQFQEKLGYEPFPGTLNIELDDDSVRARSAVNNADGILIEEWENEERTFGALTCYEAEIGGVDGHLVKPHRSHYPEDMAEVIAPVKLRDELGLEDGDGITVEVKLR